jgi:hypothetical protein
MSRSVDLPDPVYAALEEAAASSGTTPAGWIAAQLPQPISAAQPECDSQPQKTLAERPEEYIGLLHSGGSKSSSEYDEMFRDAGELHAVGTSQRALAISDEVYRGLEEEALAFGTTPEGWIAARLPRHAPASKADQERQPPRTLAERFEGYLGLISLDRTDLGARASELFAEGMEEKQRERRL